MYVFTFVIFFTVIFEYKVRLEKNLNEERNKHQETKDKLQAHLSDEQEKNKENKEAATKFTALQQQYRLLLVCLMSKLK